MNEWVGRCVRCGAYTVRDLPVSSSAQCGLRSSVTYGPVCGGFVNVDDEALSAFMLGGIKALWQLSAEFAPTKELRNHAKAVLARNFGDQVIVDE